MNVWKQFQFIKSSTKLTEFVRREFWNQARVLPLEHAVSTHQACLINCINMQIVYWNPKNPFTAFQAKCGHTKKCLDLWRLITVQVLCHREYRTPAGAMPATLIHDSDWMIWTEMQNLRAQWQLELRWWSHSQTSKKKVELNYEIRNWYFLWYMRSYSYPPWKISLCNRSRPVGIKCDLKTVHKSAIPCLSAKRKRYGFELANVAWIWVIKCGMDLS